VVGSIFLAKIYFTDLNSYKIRPVLVLQEMGDDCLCLQLTTQKYKGITLTNKDLLQGSIKKDSFIVVPKNFTIHKSILTKKLATIKTEKYRLIKDTFCKEILC